MRTTSGLWLFISFALLSAHSQVLPTTVCDVTKHPAAFDGKIVRVRATVVSNFGISSILNAERECGGRLIMRLTYPGGGPTAYVSFREPNLKRMPVKMRRDREFKKFEELLAARMYPRSRDQFDAMWMPCNRYEVTATMTGRVDYAGEDGGFGHRGMFPTQFVLQSVSEVSGKDLSSNYDLTLFSPTKIIRFPTAHLSGKVVGPNGEGVAKAKVNVHSTEDVPPYRHRLTVRTDEKGRFKAEVPPGAYVIGVNLESPPSPAVPFPPTYFPDTENSHSATVVNVSDWEYRDDLKLELKRTLISKTIPVKVVWPDGKPVMDANVCLMQQNAPTGMVGRESHTNSEGRFDLIGFEGMDYEVQANIIGFEEANIYIYEYVEPTSTVHCAGNVIVHAGDKVNEPILMVFNKSGETCR
jgi:putative lipoic acid-binding regulatory protein